MTRRMAETTSMAVIVAEKGGIKALNEVKASLGWRVVHTWVGDDPCGDGNLPPCSGVTCSVVGDYRVVTDLEVHAVLIAGPFPVAVTNLLDLTRLDLHNNKLTGPIPPQIGRLKRLRILGNPQGACNSTGASLPTSTSKPFLLLPAELGSLKKLWDVGNNRWVGTIKQLISIDGCFPALRNLYLNNNYLTDGIPEPLANLTNLESRKYLSYNKLSGEIPSEVARLPRLTSLHLDHNQFAGRIPEAFYKHPFLKEMYIEGNTFREGVNPIGLHGFLEITGSELLI
ncbi:Detected protein of confused Function [Hibiscus syriacus]|uniref:Detected protein of confused Function n=1 Tax=Hibiscus syriacus TaxID=106335 RepID=A0A6A3BJL1_HIBSY|nr:Detected protein of confused Function [Hibiscus syriacus]